MIPNPEERAGEIAKGIRAVHLLNVALAAVGNNRGDLRQACDLAEQAIAEAISAARREERATTERCHAPDEAGPFVTISRADYLRLIEATESDEMIVRCSRCRAWLDRDDPATAHVEDFEGCWKSATELRHDHNLCRSYRVSEIPSANPFR